MGKEKLYFKNLDSIRFIAALMVFLSHAYNSAYLPFTIESDFLERLRKTICNGAIGVSIFFVLSGFLITYLLVNEYEVKQKIALKNFYVRRILRIWPLYFFIVFYGFFVYPFLKSIIGVHSSSNSSFLYHLFFLGNFDLINSLGNKGSFQLQNITWSVSIEEQFYLIWPLIFVFLPKRFWMYSILSVIAGSIIFRIIHYDNWNVLYFNTFSVMLDLGIGGLMALLIKSKQSFRRFFENSSTLTHAILFILSFLLVFYNHDLFNFNYGTAVSRIFLSLLFALIISAQAFTKKDSRLNLKNLVFANKWGKYTYGIYLLHPIALTIMEFFARLFHISKTNYFNIFFIGVVGFMVTLILSKLSYKYFESRFLKLKEKFASI